MRKRSQNIISDNKGRFHIEGDWHPAPLPRNVNFDEYSYPDTAYSFIRFQSQIKNSLTLGYGSGNYGHSNFIGGKKGVIKIGKYVVLQGTTIISNESITIKDHCMFSWGSVITDSWLTNATDLSQRRKILESLAFSKSRLPEFPETKPVVIEENVWVGFKAVVLPGVTLGRGCIVGSCSIVSEDVPPYAIVAGNPARVIRFLSEDDSPEVREQAIQECSVF
jgi:acetyltransferase-like isoleucine patch superfamily enzyme